MVRKLQVEELGRLDTDAYSKTDKLPVCLVVDRVRSAHNVGSFFRTADAFMLASIHLCGYSARPPHTEIYKTALGAEDTVPWQHWEQTADCINALREKGYTIIGLEQAAESIFLPHICIEKEKPVALVVGNEVEGVAAEVLELCDLIAEIPQWGTKHSLNVSVSTGIALWHIVNMKKETAVSRAQAPG